MFGVGILGLILLPLALVVLSRTPMERKVQQGEVREAVSVPAIMYHSVVEKGAYGDYIIDTAMLRADLAYLKEHGYEAVLVQDLVAFVHQDVELPEKPILLTFDDGMLNNLVNVLPILEEYGMKGVFSVVGKYTDTYTANRDRNLKYAYMAWDDVKTLSESPNAEIASHSYSMHVLGTRRGSLRMAGESTEQYTKTLTDDLGKLQTLIEENVGITPITYAYPYGFISPESVQVVKDLGFYATLGCAEKGNLITKDADSLYAIGRYNRPLGISTEAFMAKVLK